MPTLLGTLWPVDLVRRPPRMSPEDTEIWQRWWPHHQSGAVGLHFDVGLGEGKVAGLSGSKEELFAWLRNTQKRADVLIVYPDGIDLVEVRFVASVNAVGRLLAYRKLYKEDPAAGPLKVTRLITNLRDDDVAALSAENHIAYEVV